MPRSLPSINRRNFLSAAASIGSITVLSTILLPPERAVAAVETLPQTAGYVPPVSLATIYGSNVYMKRMEDGKGIVKTYERAFTSTHLARATFYKGKDNKLKSAIAVVGKENQFQIIDVATGVNEKTSTPFGDSAGGLSTIDYNEYDAAIYSTGDGDLYKYVQGASAPTILGKLGVSTAGYGFAFDSKGRVWAGGYPKSTVSCYDPATGKITTYSAVDPEASYVRSITIINNVVYVGTGSVNPKIFSFSVDTPTVRTEIPVPSIGATGFVFKLDVHFGRLFAYYEDANLKGKTNVYDPATGKWTLLKYSVWGRSMASTKGSELVYFVCTPSTIEGLSIMQWNVRTNVYTRICASPSTSLELHIDASSGSPVLYMIGEDADGKNYLFYGVNLVTKATVLSVKADIKETAYKVEDFIVSNDGNMYVGGYMGDGLASINLTSDARWRTGMNTGINQIEGMIESDNNTIYIGSYGSADLLKYTKNPLEIKRIARLRVTYDQSRPFAWALAAGKVITGTVPDYGLQGGALAVINPIDDTLVVKDNFIARQSILGLVGSGDIVYGTTGVMGGLGAALDENPATVFAYDVKNDKLLWKNTSLTHETDIYSPTVVGNRLFVAVPNGIIELGMTDGKAISTYVMYARVNKPGWRNVRMGYNPKSNALVHRTGGSIAAINLKDNSRTLLYTDSDGGILKVTNNGRVYAVTNGSLDISEISSAYSPTITSAADLASISPGGGINLKKSDGAGGFGTGVAIIATGYADAKSVHVADWDNSGLYSLVSNHKDGSLRVRHALREGGFGDFKFVAAAGSGWDTRRITVGLWDKVTAAPDVLSIDSTGKLQHWRVWSAGTPLLAGEIGTGWAKYDIAILDYNYNGVTGLVFKEGAKMFWVPRGADGKVTPTSSSRVEIASGGWSSCVEFAVVTAHWRKYNGIVWKDSLGTLRYTSNLSSALLGGNKSYGTSLATYRIAGTSK